MKSECYNSILVCDLLLASRFSFRFRSLNSVLYHNSHLVISIRGQASATKSIDEEVCLLDGTIHPRYRSWSSSHSLFYYEETPLTLLSSWHTSLHYWFAV